jgi:hypothetical protein
VDEDVEGPFPGPQSNYEFGIQRLYSVYASSIRL